MTKEWRGPLAKMVAWLLMLAASLLNFLNFNSYPLFRPEVAIVLVGFVPIAAALGGLERATPRLAFVFTGVLVALGADLNMDKPTLPFLIGVAVLVAARFNNVAMVKIVSAAFGTVIVFQAATGAMGASAAVSPAHAAPAPAQNATTRPPIIHLLMDSYLGVEGMAADPAFAQLRTETVDFYGRNDFRLYGDAYSRHSNTANSVPYMLSFGTAEPAKVSQLDKRLPPGRLDYFDRLVRDDYAITVRGARFLDLCAGQSVQDCRQYPYTGLAALTKFPLSTVDRAKTLGITLASMSSSVSKIYNRLALVVMRLGLGRPMGIRALSKTSTPKAALTLMELQDELARPEYGKVYFVHLLLPHEPYVFDEDCNIKPRSQWHTEAEGAAKAVRVADYRAQMRCMHRLLGRLFETLQQSPAGRDAIVIVQGDHGSRIVDVRPTVERPGVSRRDYAMTYSTMFAIRAPGIEPGLVEGRASLDELLKDFAESDFSRAPAAGTRPAEIVLATRDWIPQRRAPLPDYLAD